VQNCALHWAGGALRRVDANKGRWSGSLGLPSHGFGRFCPWRPTGLGRLAETGNVEQPQRWRRYPVGPISVERHSFTALFGIPIQSVTRGRTSSDHGGGR
jgi:hypothetical protein